MEKPEVYYKRMKPFIEEFGSMFESIGIQSIAGRILGWLMICEPPHQSAEQLREILHASKGSISSSTQLLSRLGFVNKIKIPGDRKTYYKVSPMVWVDMARIRDQIRTRYRMIAQKGLRMMQDKPLETKERLIEMEHIHAFAEREIPRVMDRWPDEWLQFRESDEFRKYSGVDEE